VSIGDNNDYNAQTLDEIDERFPDYLEKRFKIHPSDDGRDNADSTSEPISTKQHKARSSAKQGEPRFKLSRDRVYQAICGHAPDPSKVSPLEFDLLSHIAATRSNGMLQGELVRATGQDKRSVPKRTDALQKKGYIIKEVVYNHGNRTSRLILKAFANTSSDADATPAQSHGTQGRSTVRDVVRRIFDVLSKQNLLPQSVLATELDMSEPAKSTVLTKIVRRLERLKLLKRVKTAFGPSASSGDLQQCIQLVRSPDDTALDDFDNEVVSLDKAIIDLLPVGAETFIEPGEAAGAGHEVEIFLTGPLEPIPDSRIAQWNPDRLMPNAFVDTVHNFGTKGMTNSVRTLDSPVDQF
jgi:transcription factor C subunit 3